MTAGQRECVWHLDRVYVCLNIIIIGLHADDVINDLIHLVFVTGADVEHGHGAVGGAVARHELLCAHAWRVEGRGCRR